MSSDGCFPSSWHSVPSKDGKFIATVLNSTVIIRLALESEKYHTFSLPQSSTSQWRFLKWYDKPSKGLSHEHTGNDWHSGSSHRFLLANDDDVLIWDVDDLKWHAEINGAANCLGRIYNVQFGSTANEVLVSSSFGVKLTIWSLLTTRGVEVKDPKTTSRFCDCRPRSGHLAILVRDTAHDALVLLPPGKPDQVKNVELATVDAQGVKWSPDGRWIAIWESGSYGYKVLTYTADGNHYKTYLRGQDTENVGLGVSMLRWSPSGSFLAIGDYNQCAVILRTNTFSPFANLYHPTMINILPSPIWQEQISASNERSYIAAPQPICPPNNSDTEGPHGISIIEYNMDGSLVATRSESIPSTVWIWSSEAASAVSVLIHHAPIKRVEWHPLIADLLLIHCNLAEPVVHLWKGSWEFPTIVNLFLDRLRGKIDATWLQNEAVGVPCMMLSTLHNYATAKISHHGKLIPWSGENERVCSGPEDMFDEGNSLDISRMKNSQNEMTKETLGDSLGNRVTGQWVVSDEVDDTFQYRRPRV